MGLPMKDRSDFFRDFRVGGSRNNTLEYVSASFCCETVWSISPGDIPETVRSFVPQESLRPSVFSAAHFGAVPRTSGAGNWRAGRHLRGWSACRLMAALCKPVTPAVCRDEATRPAIPPPAGVVSPPLPGSRPSQTPAGAPLCPPVNTAPIRAEIARGPAGSAARPAASPSDRRTSPLHFLRHSQQLPVHVKRDQRNMPPDTSLRISEKSVGRLALALSSLRGFRLSLSLLTSFFYSIFFHLSQFACTLFFSRFQDARRTECPTEPIFPHTLFLSPNLYRWRTACIRARRTVRRETESVCLRGVLWRRPETPKHVPNIPQSPTHLLNMSAERISRCSRLAPRLQTWRMCGSI